jgi:hypothetical protein
MRWRDATKPAQRHNGAPHHDVAQPPSAVTFALVLAFGYSRNATDWIPATSNRLRQRTFLQATMSSLRTI